MKIINYLIIDDLNKEAKKRKIDVLETQVSFSFSIFVNRKRTELHLYRKTKAELQKPVITVTLMPPEYLPLVFEKLSR